MKTVAIIVAALLILGTAAVTYQPAYFIAQDATIDAVVLEFERGNEGPKVWKTVLRLDDGTIMQSPGKLGDMGDRLKVRRSFGGGAVVLE